jgi:hypothetical protein
LHQAIKKEYGIINLIDWVVEKYPYKEILWKEDDSGAKRILDYLKSKNIPLSKICVGGVNSRACDCSYNDEHCTKSILKKNKGKKGVKYWIEKGLICSNITKSNNKFT